LCLAINQYQGTNRYLAKVDVTSDINPSVLVIPVVRYGETATEQAERDKQDSG
jgi:hypothetical protein